MRRLRIVGAAIAVLFAVSAFGQSITKTIYVDWLHLGNALCGGFSGNSDTMFYESAGSSWTYLKIRIPLAVGRLSDGSSPPSTVSVAINGAPVGDPVLVTNVSASCDGPYVPYEFGTTSLAGFQANGPNTFSITISGPAGAGNSGEPAELIFTTEPRKFAFDLLPSMSQRILISKRSGDSYPSPWQVETGAGARPRFRFRGAVTSATASLEADVWLRVIDPSDPSLYLPIHAPNDNQDPTPRGALMTFGCSDPSCKAPPGAPLQIHALPGGLVELELEATDRYGGDNYILEASFDPDFKCASAGANGADICARSGLVTAWKRMYLEMDEMFRDSQLIAARSLVGDSVVYVSDRGFRKGEGVRLIHAPSFGRMADYDVDGFYSEDRVVVDVARNRNPNQPGSFAITLDKPLTRPYYVDGTFLTSQLGDAIAKIDSSDPIYHLNDQYLADAFAEAFVDVVKASSSGIRLPLYASMSLDDMVYVGGKWFGAREFGATPSNFGLVVAAAARVPLSNTTTSLSLGTTRGAQSYVWSQTIDDATSGPRSKYPLTSKLNPDTVNGEVLVHEIAHQWTVNSTYPNNECDKRSYADPAKWCQGAGTQNSGEYGDGIVKFHYVGNSPGTADSEYITIRRTGEPKP